MFEGIFQPVHLLIIAGIALFAFGPRKLPELGKGLGEGIRAFKAGLQEAQAESTSPARNSAEPPAPAKT